MNAITEQSKFIPTTYTCLSCGAHIPSQYMIEFPACLSSYKNNMGGYLIKNTIACETCARDSLLFLTYNAPGLFRDSMRSEIINYAHDNDFLELYDEFKKEVDEREAIFQKEKQDIDKTLKDILTIKKQTTPSFW